MDEFALTPTQYIQEINLPTVKEFMASRADRRLAYLSCQSTLHICDYIFRADAKPLNEVRGLIRDVCTFSFDVVEGVANGSKHCGRNRGAYKHQPGSERVAPSFTFGVSYLDRDRLDIPGLEIEHDGKCTFLDGCVCDFLIGAETAFPIHFAGIDMNWLKS